jgi:hypothetical protein
MSSNRLVLAISLAVVCSVPVQAQTGAGEDQVKVARYDDGMSSGVYAYVRSFGGIIQRIDDEGITFTERDPALVWACISGELVAVYLYDTGMLGEDGSVRVRYRFDNKPASPAESWEKLPVPKAQMELLATMLGGADPEEIRSNPMVQTMLAAMSLGAQMPAESVEEFLASARSAEEVTFQVTDPADGESFTDSFMLSGFAEALKTVREACGSE